MKDPIFLGLLQKQDLFPGNLQDEVMAKPTPPEKASCFLDTAIKPSLDIGIVEPLSQLLEVMSNEKFNSIPLKQIAKDMKQELGNDTSHLPATVTG